MSRKPKTPVLQHHKATGRGRGTIDGKDHYLGPFGSVACRQEYEELLAEWLSRQTHPDFTLTVDELALLFLEHAQCVTTCRVPRTGGIDPCGN